MLRRSFLLSGFAMLKRISVADVRLGMYVKELCGSWMEHSFWRTQFLLGSERDLRRVRDSGIRELWIDTDKGLDVERGSTVDEVEVEAEARLLAAEAAPATAPVALDTELERAFLLCERAREAVVSMFSDVRMGQVIEGGRAAQLVDEIAASVSRHPDALISLARLKRADEYTYMHSIAVCALMIAWRAGWGWPTRWSGKRAWPGCCTTSAR